MHTTNNKVKSVLWITRISSREGDWEMPRPYDNGRFLLLVTTGHFTAWRDKFVVEIGRTIMRHHAQGRKCSHDKARTHSSRAGRIFDYFSLPGTSSMQALCVAFKNVAFCCNSNHFVNLFEAKKYVDFWVGIAECPFSCKSRRGA